MARIAGGDRQRIDRTCPLRLARASPLPIVEPRMSTVESRARSQAMSFASWTDEPLPLSSAPYQLCRMVAATVSEVRSTCLRVRTSNQFCFQICFFFSWQDPGKRPKRLVNREFVSEFTSPRLSRCALGSGAVWMDGMGGAAESNLKILGCTAQSNTLSLSPSPISLPLPAPVALSPFALSTGRRPRCIRLAFRSLSFWSFAPSVGAVRSSSSSSSSSSCISHCSSSFSPSLPPSAPLAFQPSGGGGCQRTSSGVLGGLQLGRPVRSAVCTAPLPSASCPAWPCLALLCPVMTAPLALPA